MKRFETTVTALAIATLTLLFLCPATTGLSQPSQGDNLSRLVSLLQKVDNPQFQLDVLTGIRDALKGQRHVAMPDGWKAAEKQLLKSPNQEVRSLTQSLGVTFGSKRALKQLRSTLKDSSAPSSKRKQALQALMQANDPKLPPILHRLLDQPALRGTILKGLAQYNHPDTPEAILETFPRLTPSEQRIALNTLASRRNFAKHLLEAIQNNTVSKQALTADLVQRLRKLEDPKINQTLKRLWGVARKTDQEKQKQIRHYRQVYRSAGDPPGNASRGRALFVQRCQQCHTLFGIGNDVGPDLTGSNRDNLDYILQNILDPNALIPNEYRTSILKTTDGRILSGIVQRQDANAVTIQTVTQSVTVPRNEIASLETQSISMMPEGLLGGLSDRQVRDLLYYLAQPTQVPVTATPFTVDLFFNGNDLTNWRGNPDLWKVTDGTIVGKTKTGLDHNEFLKSQMVLSDFRLVCQVKLIPNSENSGIQFRSQPHGDGEMKGYQADIGKGWWGKLYEEQGRGLLWEKSGEAFVQPDHWNTYEIVAVEHRIKTAINGHRCVNLEDPQGDTQGLIGLQLHSGGPMEVRFKDFQIDLKPQPKLKTAQEK